MEINKRLLFVFCFALNPFFKSFFIREGEKFVMDRLLDAHTHTPLEDCELLIKKKLRSEKFPDQCRIR